MNKAPAYHLRTNKSVERLLFIELLRKINGCLPQKIENYEYVSLGGPYLEDFNLIHGAFGNKKMRSLEIKKHIRTRQEINAPHSGIILDPLQSTGKYIEKFKPGYSPLLVWLDFEWPKWDEQIAEACELLQKLPKMSILKITLIGKTDWLGGNSKDPLVERAERLSEKFGDYGVIEPGEISKNNICDTLYKILRSAISSAIPDSQRKIVSTLASYQYNDGTPVLTVTLIVGPPQDIERVIEESQLRRWLFADIGWNKIKHIAIPNLSMREKLAVDRLLPKASARTIVNKLNLRLEENFIDSVSAIENYIEFYRHVPQFVRVTL
jgi:hypothetical protein